MEKVSSRPLHSLENGEISYEKKIPVEDKWSILDKIISKPRFEKSVWRANESQWDRPVKSKVGLK